LRQPVHFRSDLGTAGVDDQVQAALTAATSFVSESFASPKSMTVFGS
jgi:hypothetical protein